MPTNWSFGRTTYGLPDNNNDGLPDATGSIDLTKIDRDRYRPGDVLHSKYVGGVLANTIVPYNSWNYVFGEWNFSMGTWQPVGTASVVIKRGSTVYNLSGIAITSLSPATQKFQADWNSSASLPAGFKYLPGDSVIVQADFRLVGNLSSFNYYNTVDDAGYDSNTAGISLLSETVYASQVAAPSSSTGTAGPDRYTCFIPKYNANIIGLGHAAVLAEGVNPVGATGCDEFPFYGNAQSPVLGSTSAGRYFNYEYRPVSIPDSIVYDIPAGWSYSSSNSFILFYSTTPGNGGSMTFALNPTVVPNGSGSRLVYDFKTAFATGAIPHWGTEADNLIMRPILKATCSTPSTAPIVQKEYGHYADYPSVASPAHFVISYGNTLNYSTTGRPDLSIQNNTGVVRGVKPQQYWDVQVSNTSLQTAPYVWMALEKGTSGISIDSVVLKPSNVVLSAASYGSGNSWYQVSAAGLATGVNQQARVYFKYTSCNPDSIMLKVGWNCSGFPSPNPTAYSCEEETKYLVVEPELSQVQIAMVKQPTLPSIPLCTADYVEVVINSAQSANVDNPVLKITPPAGMTISTPIAVEYPLGSGTWQNLSPTLTAGSYYVNLENHTGVGASGLFGTVLNAGAAGRQIKARISYNSSCAFVSGSRLKFTVFGSSPCGLPSDGSGQFVNSDPINITGATATGSVGLTMSMTNTILTCTAPENLALQVIPVGAATAVGDTAVYTLPVGIEYTGTFTPGANCTGCTITSSTAASGITTLKVAIPSAIATGTAINFTVGIKASANGDGCGDKTVEGELQRAIGGLSCGGTPCTSSKAVVGSAFKVITIQKPKLDVTAFTFSQSGTTVTYSLTIKNNGTAASAAGYDVKIYCGAYASGVVLHTLTSNAIAVGATDTYTGTFSAAGCANGTQLYARVETKLASGATACTCSEPLGFPTVNPLPVTLVSFKARKEEQTAVLNWETSAEINSRQFEVEQSINGKTWSKIGIVDANGNSKEKLNYSFKDETPDNGVNFYRLRMVDLDGHFTYSRIVNLEFEINNQPSLFPSPVTDKLNISFSDWDKVQDLEMFNETGRLVYQAHRGSSIDQLPKQIDVKGFAPGLYLVRLRQKNGSLSTHKVIVIR